jgi:hypothetical protein
MRLGAAEMLMVKFQTTVAVRFLEAVLIELTHECTQGLELGEARHHHLAERARVCNANALVFLPFPPLASLLH